MLRWLVSSLFILGLTVALIEAQTSEKIAADQAKIVIKVPADAIVVFGGQQLGSTGPERSVTIGAGNAGPYTVEVSATWKEGGQGKSAKKSVSYQGGQSAVVDFTQGTTGKDDPPKVEPKKVETPKAEPKKAEPVKVEPKKVDAPKQAEPKTAKPPSAAAKDRSFHFTYAGKVVNVPAKAQVKVWIPLAVSTAEQEITILKQEIAGDVTVNKDKLYGNSILHFTGLANEAGEIPFKVEYKVKRKEVVTNAKANVTMKANESKELVTRFLAPDAKVPIQGKPLELIKDKKLPDDQYAAAKIMYEVVNDHMKYSKEGTGWGQGDSVWACDSKFGNCSDFHSLFISMARGNKIPSKFEMGFPIPPKRGEGVVGGYHCWAWFMPGGKGWVPVDISEANRYPSLKDYYFGNLSEDRVQFTTGRDIQLEPRQSGPALNFFVYPYVEIDGQPAAADKVQRAFAYKDL